jgi:hypothetical protein
METWYEVPRRYGWTVKTLEVEKFNEKSVWINGRRRARESYYDILVETPEEAHALLLKRCLSDIDRLSDELEKTKQVLKDLKGE